MECALVKGAHLPAGDALAFRAEIDRLAGALEDARGALEDALSPFGVDLVDGPEDADQIADHAEGHELAQEAGEEEARVGQPERDEHEHIDRRRVVRDVDHLPGRHALAIVHDVANAEDGKHRLAHRRRDPFAVEAPRLKQGQHGRGQHDERADREERHARDETQCEFPTHEGLRRTIVCMARLSRFSKARSGSSSSSPRK